MLTKNEIAVGNLAIMIVGLHLFISYFINKWNNFWGCELPDVTCQKTRHGVGCPATLEAKPMSVHELTVYLHNVQKNWCSWKANIGLSFNFMSNILPIQHDSCSEISWLFPNLKGFFSPCHFLTCGNDFLTERKVLLAHTLQLKRGSQNRDFKKEFVEVRCY